MNKTPIVISVKSTWLEKQSQPENKRFAFAYKVTIKNNSDHPAKLVSRHWIITNANNVTQEVKGEGVIGRQPRILPGESFVYTSGAILETPVGTMEGTYDMQTDTGETFTVTIPAFVLNRPNSLH